MSAPRERRLVALRLPGGVALAAEVADRRAAGDAVMPVDPALPAPALDALLNATRPSVLVDERGETHLPEPLPVAPDLAAVITTSGTTGTPKAVELSTRALAAGAQAANSRLGAAAGDRWLCCVSLWRIAGFAILDRAKALGTAPVVHPDFDVERVRKAGPADFVSLVPTMLARLLDAGVDLARFKAVLLGGGPLPSDLVRRAEESGARVVRSYGLTETCGGVVYDGRALDGVAVEVDPAGDIFIAGPTLMSGYRGDPARTAAVLREGRLRTGDYGRLPPDGMLEVLGRRDDTIFTGGEKVVPAVVAEVLERHPLVARAHVAGRPDSEWGQRVVAFVAPADPQRPPTPAELRAWVARTLPRYMAPKEIETVST